MPQFPNSEGFILAGGKSSRMGSDKALLEFGGITILQRTADLAAPLVSRVSLITSSPAASEVASPYAQLKLPLIGDRWPGAGPLGGITTALLSASADLCLILACDLPHLTQDWLAFLLDRSAKSGADAVVPETAKGLEPLCAVYRASRSATLAAALDGGVRKVTDALAALKISKIPESEWRPFSQDGLLFHNMNTRQDYLDARQNLKT